MNEKKGKHWKLIIPGIILALVLLIAAVFHVNEITVEGNTFFSQEVVAGEVCNTFLDHNVVSSWIKRKLGFCPTLPYVREYQVTYPGIHKIHIKLYEKKMIAGISYMNQFIYFDKDGVVLKSTQDEIKGIPLFETKTMTTFSLYEKVQMEDEALLSSIMNLSGLFQHYGVTWDRVVFDSDNAAFLYSGDIKVNLGKKDNYDEAIAALSDILKTAKEQKLSGEIDMSSYRAGGDVILKKN